MTCSATDLVGATVNLVSRARSAAHRPGSFPPSGRPGGPPMEYRSLPRPRTNLAKVPPLPVPCPTRHVSSWAICSRRAGPRARPGVASTKPASSAAGSRSGVPSARGRSAAPCIDTRWIVTSSRRRCTPAGWFARSPGPTCCSSRHFCTTSAGEGVPATTASRAPAFARAIVERMGHRGGRCARRTIGAGAPDPRRAGHWTRPCRPRDRRGSDQRLGWHPGWLRPARAPPRADAAAAGPAAGRTGRSSLVAQPTTAVRARLDPDAPGTGRPAPRAQTGRCRTCRARWAE